MGDFEAGKIEIENTKKAISDFANVSTSGNRKKETFLEDKIVQNKHVPTAWDNGKTIRNDNSSCY